MHHHPKTRRFGLTKWEYSDPIGVPHPDVVDVAVTLKNNGTETVSNLEVEVARQWRTGPLSDAERATWADRTVLKKFQGITVAPAAIQTLRVPIDLKAMMNTLWKQQSGRMRYKPQ